jgi:hypothetical protein
MPTATVQYGAYVFSTTGRPQYGARRRYESDVPNTPATRATVTYTVQHIFVEDTFADNQARFRALKEALLVAEGVLFITDENGTELVNQLVRVEDSDLPAQWGQHVTEVTVSFSATEALDGSSAVDAAYTPTGGALIPLPYVLNWRESIKAERYAIQVNNRKESVGNVSASGRVRSDPALDSDARRAYLQGVEQSIKAIVDSKDGTLAWGTFSKVVRVDTVDTDLHDGSDYLDWSIACSYQRYPNGAYAEADLTVATKDDLEKRERQTSVHGTVRANTRAAAVVKTDEMIAIYATGRTLKGREVTDHDVDGVDGSTWIEMNFSVDFRETLSSAAESYTLTIADKDDLKAGQLITTYSGKVVAETASAAITKARVLGNGKYPMRISANEVVNTTSVSGDEYFVEVTFSYEYMRKGALAYAEVTSDVDKQTFGSNTTTTSGYTVAPTYAAAIALARSFKPGTGLLRSEKETSSVLDAGVTAQHNRVDFSYVFHAVKSAGSIQYQVKTSNDYRQGEATLSYTGTAWSDTEANADALINALVVDLPSLATDERTSSFDKGGVNAFISRQFSISFVNSLAGSSYQFGTDGIKEATYSLETTYSIQATVITPIPYGVPHVQTNVGLTPGMQVATGTITAISAAAAKAWARGKIPAGGYLDPPREKLDEVYLPGSSSVIKHFRLDFTYAKRSASLTNGAFS